MPKYRPMKSPVRRPGMSGFLIWPRPVREQAGPGAQERRLVQVPVPPGRERVPLPRESWEAQESPERAWHSPVGLERGQG